MTGVQTVQSKVQSKAKVKQSKLFVFSLSPLLFVHNYLYIKTITVYAE
nr:MAG TPA: hypothetical protein [Caudoviricetes sp.]DAQ00025.1 MAG TPA: hypothetical protein [Caudoviricetes sp.]